MFHALGLGPGMSDRPYRNRSWNPETSPATQIWRELEDMGYAVQVRTDPKNHMICFAVTDRGLAAINVTPLANELEPSERHP
jgi:Cys-tRNA synthase (O-phospho-L-seryl-tRNA:Cys-tRNA synthase)